MNCSKVSLGGPPLQIVTAIQWGVVVEPLGGSQRHRAVDSVGQPVALHAGGGLCEDGDL